MSGQVVRKFKWFWDDADYAIESWLQEMARQGLHLHRVRCVRTVFEFKRGEPADVTYRVDFLLTRPNPDLLQLFNDAGWERVDHLLGWQYWRAPTGTGRSPEIFTDVPSQIKKYQRLLWLFAFSWLPVGVLILLRGSRVLEGPAVAHVLLAATAGITGYAVVRLLIRIRKLRGQSPP